MTPILLREAFVRDADGSWRCVAPTRIDHPAGRIEVTQGTRLVPGRFYMGVDLAAWLEEKLGK
jgi:hypothetical protein